MVHSISKTPIGADVAAHVVADAFGADVVLVSISELTEGWFNAAYLLDLDDGRRCVLKVAPPPGVAVLTYERDIMATEVAALRLVRERTSVPVPAVLWSDPSCRHVPSALFLMEHCTGELLHACRAELSPDEQARIDGQLAGHLAAMNAITHPTFGLPAPGSPASTRWSEAFARLLDDVVADGERMTVALPVGGDALRAVARRHADALDEVTVPRFVHWDLWDSNVFVDRATATVTGVIDFERALWGDPLMEGQFWAKADDAAFLAAYGAPLLDAPGAPIRRLLYDVYLFLIMTIEVAYRQYPTDDIERFGRRHLGVTLERLGLS